MIDVNITFRFGWNWALVLRQKHTSVTSWHHMPPFFQVRKATIRLQNTIIKTLNRVFLVHMICSKIWDFCEALLGAENGKHFSCGKNIYHW